MVSIPQAVTPWKCPTLPVAQTTDPVVSKRLSPLQLRTSHASGYAVRVPPLPPKQPRQGTKVPHFRDPSLLVWSPHPGPLPARSFHFGHNLPLQMGE